MSENVLGVLQVVKRAFPYNKNELLFTTSDRVIVARLPAVVDLRGAAGYTDDILGDIVFAVIAGYNAEQSAKKFRKAEERLQTMEVEDILKADKHNFAIPNSDITKFELFKKGWWHTGIELNIITSVKKYKWCYVRLMKIGVALQDEFRHGTLARIEDCENILRPVFGDRLFVKK